MSDVLDAVLSVFECDRAWLSYPCDPQAVSAGVKMQRTRAEFPGLFAIGVEAPMDAETADLLRTVRASSGPVRLGPTSQHPLPAKKAKRLGIQSGIVTPSTGRAIDRTCSVSASAHTREPGQSRKGGSSRRSADGWRTR